MKIKTMYESDDGQLFDTEKAAKMADSLSTMSNILNELYVGWSGDTPTYIAQALRYAG